ncbi:lysylphosphatidylglycerol synthase transmembrane domain-containing protein [Kushneria aurantia]|uniref:YbhN family protein n=1 Tax=Kushneria aurantia TaxID=504092 RepID=A0ABV6G2X3_9GAMM|nr:lysylphosphatidylglycerol synthase transmembrane domain-containing protein [Kushneria aurantia]
MNRTLWLLLAGLIAVLAIPLTLGGTDLLHLLSGFPLSLLALMLGMVLLCWVANGAKLRLLLAGRAGRLGQTRATGIVIASEFAFSATPGGSGGPLTLIALLNRHGVRPAQTTAIFAIDQIIDLLFFLGAMMSMMIYIISRSLDARLGWLLALPMSILVVLLVTVLLMGRYHRQVLLLSGRLLGRLRVRPRMRRAIARRILTFKQAFTETLRLPWWALAGAFLLGLVHWLLRYSVLYITLYGLGQHLDWVWTFLVQMLSMAAGQLTLLPGGAGGAELSASALLSPIVGQSTAAAAILIWRAVTYYFYLIAGAPVFMLLAGKPLLKRIMSGRSEQA